VKRLLLSGLGLVVAVGVIAGGAARGSSQPGSGSLLAVVREGNSNSSGCGQGGPAGSPALFAVFPPPATGCPAAACASAPTGVTKKRPKAPQPVPCPKPRPDGIYLVGADGRNPRWFAAGVEPAWSSDGTEVAYSTGRFLAIQGVDGNPPRDVIVALPNLLANASGEVGSPSWSPDAKQIVFSVFHTDTTLTGAEWREELFSVDVATRDLRPLTAAVAGESDHSPAFSPDGSEIAYAHWGAQPGIWLINAHDNRTRQIAAVDGYPTGVSWSLDGQSIAFALRETPSGNSEIYVVRANGGGLRRVATTGDETILDRPTWAPAGEDIEFTANDTSGDARALYAVRPDGTALHRVLREPWAIYQPAWQPRPT
jgi:Tol biopolymer transport system component